MMRKHRPHGLHRSTRAGLVLLAVIVAGVPIASGQADATLPAYDVVSVKVNKSDSGNMSINSNTSHYSASNVSLKNLVGNAYGMKEFLIFGAPGWANSARFDIEAKMVDPDPEAIKKMTPEQQRSLLQPMLAERFKLKVHTETRTFPVYELVLAKGGPKFKASPPEEAGGTWFGNGTLGAHAIDMDSLAGMLAYQLHETVLDKTGLTGKFDLTVKWTTEYAPDATPESSTASLLTALQEQLGLKLRSAKGPVETLVIDSVVMPSEN